MDRDEPASMAKLSAGELSARVRFDGDEVSAIELRLDRPVGALAGLRGKLPADCLRLLPLLFPLCGTAHALAALQGIEAALSIQPEPGHLLARETLALADMVAAQVWRTCIDWAQLAGHPVKAAPVAQARRLVARIALAAYPDGDSLRIGGGRLAPQPAELAAARDELRQLRLQLDLSATLEQLRAPMVGAMSGADPEWMARVECSLADMVDATAASFRALDGRLEDLLQVQTTTPHTAGFAEQSGRGSGVALTARGELCYEIDIVSARVVACRMSAPTDRVFAADGPVAQLLRGLRCAHQPLLAVRWVLAAFDPCIQVHVVAAD